MLQESSSLKRPQTLLLRFKRSVALGVLLYSRCLPVSSGVSTGFQNPNRLLCAFRSRGLMFGLCLYSGSWDVPGPGGPRQPGQKDRGFWISVLALLLISPGTVNNHRASEPPFLHKQNGDIITDSLHLFSQSTYFLVPPASPAVFRARTIWWAG